MSVTIPDSISTEVVKLPASPLLPLNQNFDIFNQFSEIINKLNELIALQTTLVSTVNQNIAVLEDHETRITALETP